MGMQIQEPSISKDIDGKKKKKSKLENVKESKVDKKVTELNGSLKEENDLDVTHEKKKKKQKKNKLAIESIDGDEEKPDCKDKKKKKKGELNASLKEENDLQKTEGENDDDVTDHKKKKQKKKAKLVTDSIDEDEKKSDIKSVLPKELKTSLSEERPDTKDKKEKKKKKSELNVSLKEENDVQTTEGENDVDVTDHKKKKQKKKDKLVTESIDGDEKKTEEKAKTSLSEETLKSKDKKKKNKSEVTVEEENDIQMTEAENDVAVSNKKKKKEKKNKLVIESIDGDEKKLDIELPVEKPKTSPSEETTNTKDKKKNKKTKNEAKEIKSLEPSDIGADNDLISKKRKRSDEIEVQPAEETTVKDSKRRKSEGSDVDSKQIFANGEIAGNDPLKLTTNGTEKSGQKQQRKDSAEPKTVHAFQRVKIDEVEFVDDRLQDNSYWAKSGAEKGYGAKAQEILGQVKGRDFRHEKTKKKRGSYRGGLIDQDSHSIKFNYSDEE